MLELQQYPDPRNKPDDNIGGWLDSDGRRERPVDVPKPTSSQATRSKKQPKSQPQAIRSGRERERKRRGLPGGGGDGSDDSGDESNKKRPQDDADVDDNANRSRNWNITVTSPVPSDASSDDSGDDLPSIYEATSITDPAIRRSGEATLTPAVLAMRERNRADGIRERIRLCKQDFNEHFDRQYSRLLHSASAKNGAMEEFKKEALYSAIVDNDEREQEATATHELGVQLIAEAEQIVCNLIKTTMEGKVTVTCDDCTQEQLYWPFGGAILIPENVEVTANTPLRSHAHFRLPFQVRHAEDGAYADVKVIRRLTDPKTRVIEALFLHPKWFAKAQAASKSLKALVDTILRVVVDGTSDAEACDPRLHVRDMLFNSRLADRLTPEYVSWISGKCGLADFNRLLEEKRRENYLQRRDTTISVFREAMLAKQIPWSQEFWTDLAQSGANEGQLGYFERGNLKKSRRVEEADWERIGWRRTNVGKRSYVRCWRYAVFEDSPDRVFAVSIDDEVLGRCCGCLGGCEKKKKVCDENESQICVDIDT